MTNLSEVINNVKNEKKSLEVALVGAGIEEDSILNHIQIFLNSNGVPIGTLNTILDGNKEEVNEFLNNNGREIKGKIKSDLGYAQRVYHIAGKIVSLNYEHRKPNGIIETTLELLRYLNKEDQKNIINSIRRDLMSTEVGNYGSNGGYKVDREQNLVSLIMTNLFRDIIKKYEPIVEEIRKTNEPEEKEDLKLTSYRALKETIEDLIRYSKSVLEDYGKASLKKKENIISDNSVPKITINPDKVKELYSQIKNYLTERLNNNFLFMNVRA